MTRRDTTEVIKHMDKALEDVAFLANSNTRVAVLELLAKRPHHRDELLDRIEASRITLARTLTDLEARQWIDRTGQNCRITPLGAWVTEEFTDVREMMSTANRLRDVVVWLPTDHISFDIRRLHDATIIVPTDTTIAVHVQRIAACLRGSDRVQMATSQTALPIVEATAKAVTEDGQRFEGVLTPAVIETITNDSTMAPLFASLLESPSASLYVSEEPLDVSVFIADGTVGLPLTDDDGVVRALILSADDAVTTWATDTVERYRTRAEPVRSPVITA